MDIIGKSQSQAELKLYKSTVHHWISHYW